MTFFSARQYPSASKDRPSTSWLAALSNGGGSFVCLRDTNRLRRDAEAIERDNFAPTFEII